MSFAQPLPAWALVLALVVIALLSWRAVRRVDAYSGAVWRGGTGRRVGLFVLRALALLTLLAMVMRPVRLAPDPGSQGVFAVLVDASRSMGLRDAKGRSRIEAAREVVREAVPPALAGGLRYDVLAFGNGVREVRLDQLDALAATAPTTDVTLALEALRRKAATQRVVGALIVSDGGFTLPVTSVPAAVSAPVFTLGVGSAVVERDREVRDVTAGDASITGAAVDLTATLVSAGDNLAPVEVRVSGNGRPIEVRRVVPAGDGVPTEVVFEVAPDPNAATLYTIDAVPQEGELTVDNNRRSVLVPPPGRPRRVLLIEGAPGFEHSFLKRALEQDKGLELDAVVRKGQTDEGQQTFYVQARKERGQPLTRGFPASRQALFVYDAVVLANVQADALTREQMALLSEYVAERGGGLLVLGARSFDADAVAGTPLEELLPVAISDRRSDGGVVRAQLSPRVSSSVTLTTDGERHPVMRMGSTLEQTRARWGAMPALAAVASIGEARPGASVLAVTAGANGVARPLVAVQRFGRGRVLAFSGEAAWRWRMMLPSSDTSYETFWRQAARWLASATPEPVSVRTRPTGSGSLEVLVDVRDDSFRPVRDADVRIQFRAADGTAHTATAVPERQAAGTYRADVRLASGAARVEVEALAKGASLGRETTWALVGDDDTEMVEPRRNDAQLARLAQRYGGRLVSPGEMARVMSEVTAARAKQASFVERDLWHSPWWLTWLIGLLVGEWVLRRRWGLR